MAGVLEILSPGVEDELEEGARAVGKRGRKQHHIILKEDHCSQEGERALEY
jgi:hypothetical protein